MGNATLLEHTRRNYLSLVDKIDASLVTVLPDLLLAISDLLNFRNSCLSLEKWKPQTNVAGSFGMEVKWR